MQQLIEQLILVLKPFADAANRHDSKPDNKTLPDTTHVGAGLTVGDLKSAREFLRKISLDNDHQI